ncbi:MAG: YfhO family protein [Oscillospiraceae bacterium]|nr:YfhO family protein [Oscillospiraceae bacterium]
MDKSRLNKIKWNYTALAFLFPFVGMLIFMLVGEIVPFGKSSMLYSDMYHQYYPFFLDFRRSLLSGNSLLYNWSVGLGMDYLGLYSYYLASPLNLLSVLIPENWVLSYFSMLTPIKLGLASMFFAIFLKKIYQKNDLSIAMFGSFYGMCAWAMGYQWNIMWLDTFALLPLVVLGMVALLKERKFILYTFTLFLSIWANYYIGLFTCIFILLIFFCYEICRWQGIVKFLKDLGVMAVFSLLAIGLTAILELPTLAALQNTQSSVNKFPQGFQLNITSNDTWMGLLDAMRQVAGNMNGGLEPTFKEGLPNVYCGVITTILAFLYLSCDKIRRRDKLCCVFLLLLFNVSFIIRQLDYIWHGFHFTNMIPYRFSFLYSFVLLYMAYGAWTHRDTIRLWQIAFSALLSIAVLLCTNDFKDSVFWAYNGALLLIYFTTLVCEACQKDATSQQQAVGATVARQKKKRLAAPTPQNTYGIFLLGIMVVELILNLVNFGVNFSKTSITNYPKGKDTTASVIDYMKEQEKDTLFYRTEATHGQTLNDGALNGYNGITAFTSSANVRVTEFMKALGYGAKNTYNRYSFEESSPVSNLFLDLKYMLERDGDVEENAYFDTVYNEGNVYLLKNNAYLPLGFLANSQLVNTDFSNTSNTFQFQNDLMKDATGISDNVWYSLPESSLTINADGPTVDSQKGNGYCSYSSTSSSTITYSYTIDREGFMCITLDLSKRNSYSVWLNGQELFSETHSLPQSIAVSNVQPSDVVEIRLKCKKDEKGTIKISGAILDEKKFRAGYDVLAASTLELTEFRSTYVAGTIDCDRDGVLYTSIPQNGNWHATVDGKPAEIVLIGNAMCGLLLSEGQHEIEFTYHNSAFSLGLKISALCLAILVALYFVIYRPKRRIGKYQNRAS